MAFPQGQGVPTAMGVTPARPSNTGMSAGPSGMNPSPPPGGGPAVIPPGPVPGVPMDAPPPPMTGQAVPMEQGRVYDLNQDAPTDGGPGGGVMAQLEASGLSGQALMEALIGVLSQMGMSKVRFNGEEMPLGPGAMSGPGMGPGGPPLA